MTYVPPPSSIDQRVESAAHTAGASQSQYTNFTSFRQALALSAGAANALRFDATGPFGRRAVDAPQLANPHRPTPHLTSTNPHEPEVAPAPLPSGELFPAGAAMTAEPCGAPMLCPPHTPQTALRALYDGVKAQQVGAPSPFNVASPRNLAAKPESSGARHVSAACALSFPIRARQSAMCPVSVTLLPSEKGLHVHTNIRVASPERARLRCAVRTLLAAHGARMEEFYVNGDRT